MSTAEGWFRPDPEAALRLIEAVGPRRMCEPTGAAMTECACIVVSHPAGDVWTTRSTTPCDTHRHGQPWRDETRGDA